MNRSQKQDVAFDIGMTVFVVIFFALAVWVYHARTGAALSDAATKITMRKI